MTPLPMSTTAASATIVVSTSRVGVRVDDSGDRVRIAAQLPSSAWPHNRDTPMRGQQGRGETAAPQPKERNHEYFSC